jgi:hypothetical protein
MFWVMAGKVFKSFFRKLKMGMNSQNFGFSFCHDSCIESNLSERFIWGKNFSEYQAFVQKQSTEFLYNKHYTEELVQIIPSHAVASRQCTSLNTKS